MPPCSLSDSSIVSMDLSLQKTSLFKFPAPSGCWGLGYNKGTSLFNKQYQFWMQFFFHFFEKFFECGCKICLKTNQMMLALQKGYYEL